MDNYDLNTDIMMITIMSFLGFCIEDREYRAEKK